MTTHETSGKFLEAAAEYREWGFALVPTKGKDAFLSGWERAGTPSDEDQHHWGNGLARNIGIVLGAPSGGLVDIDRDRPTDELEPIDRMFLPDTLESGRESRPKSHHWFYAPGVRNRDLYDADGRKFLEVRADGRQTVVWPSVHPDGDGYLWHGKLKEIAVAGAQELELVINEWATALLLAIHMPDVGSRHDYALSASGFLLRDDRLDPEAVERILLGAWKAARADGKRRTVREVQDAVWDTNKKLENGEEVKGGPSLDELVPFLPKRIARIWGWPSPGSRAKKDSFNSYREGVSNETFSLPFRSAKRIAEETQAETEWIAKPWVAKGTITEVSGAIKRSGKTTWLTCMCRKVLDGADFMDQPTTKTGVVYLTEQSPNSFRKAIKTARLEEREDFHVLYWHEASAVPWPEVVRMATDYALEVGAELMVVDVISRWTGLLGDSENNAGAAMEAMRPLKEAVGRGVTVTYARHDRKGGGEVGESGRGSSQFGGDADQLIQLKRPEGNTRKTVRVLEAVGRFGDETPDSLMIELDLSKGEYSSLGDSGAFVEREAMGVIDEILPTTPENAMKTEDVVDEAKKKAGCKRSAVINALNKMADVHKTIVRLGKGKRGDPHRYYKPLGPDAGDDEEKVSFETPSPRNQTNKNESRAEEEKGRAVHVNDEPYEVYIGGKVFDRSTGKHYPASIWRNPHNKAYRDDLITRQESCDLCLTHVLLSPELMEKLPDIAGKVLGCWCREKPCHGDGLVELAWRFARRLRPTNEKNLIRLKMVRDDTILKRIREKKEDA